MPAILKLWFKVPEKLRFLLVGGWNTAFSLILFSMLFFLFNDYKIALVLNHFISVLQSFLSLKFFVFRARGKIFFEYLKVNLVYLLYFVLNLILILIFVEIGKINPIVSQILITCILLIFSYLGNKYFTFKDGKR